MYGVSFMWEVAVMCNGWLPIHWALQLANCPSSRTTVLTEWNLQPAIPMCNTHTCTYAVWTGVVCVDCVLTSHTPWPSYLPYLQCFILPSHVWYILSCCWHSLVCIAFYTRAIATSPVSPVSTGPLFPSPMACLASPNRANARRTPMACTQRGDCMLKVNARWPQTVQKNLFRVFQELSVFQSEQLVLQASSAKGVACEISKRLEGRNQFYMRRNRQKG